MSIIQLFYLPLLLVVAWRLHQSELVPDLHSRTITSAITPFPQSTPNHVGKYEKHNKYRRQNIFVTLHQYHHHYNNSIHDHYISVHIPIYLTIFIFPNVPHTSIYFQIYPNLCWLYLHYKVIYVEISFLRELVCCDWGIAITQTA